jgi:peptidoglycan glycosyltransferase
MGKRGVFYTVTGLVVIGALACAFLTAPTAAAKPRRGESGALVPAKAKAPDYSNITSLELFRQVCTTTGIPSSGAAEFRLSDGNVARLSFDQALQSGIRKYMEKSRVPYAVFVAIEPKTGRILANVSYSSLMPSWEPLASFYSYPMASLFKIVTAAAAFESGKATAETLLPFRGGPCSESPNRWGKMGRSRDAGMPLGDALAHSVNPAFGRLAADRLGKPLLVATAQHFGFGAYPFGGDFIASGKIPSPTTNGELMRMAAGLDRNVRISPFHVAMLFAAIGNGGVMPTPSFVDAVNDPAGKNLYNFTAAPLNTITSPAVASELIRAMSGTVSSGTARKAFSGPTGQRFRTGMIVAGKTGSINGDNPRGHYGWFAGVAPAADPKIAFVALVVNGNLLKLKAPQLGRTALDIFFRAGS